LIQAKDLRQGASPSGPNAPDAPDIMVRGRIPIQGELTDASGSPLSGDYEITFRLYDAETAGTQLCMDTQTLSLVKGLFSTAIEGCSTSDLNGQQVYLGIQVGADDEMTPRQPLYPVPYAFSLIPGADLTGSLSGQSMFSVVNSNSEFATGLFGRASAASGETYAVEGRCDSPSGYGGYFRNTTSNGVALKAAGSGVIQSTAESYLWVSGNSLVKAKSDDTTKFSRDLYGGFVITGGSGWATPKVVVLPVTIAGQLYGQNVTVTDLDLYYTVSADLTGISTTNMRRQNGVGAGDSIFTDSTDYSCTPGNQCQAHWDLTQNNVLSDGQGILYIAFELTFASDTDNVQIGGVRLTLQHE
jgi:hypothetical protein